MTLGYDGAQHPDALVRLPWAAPQQLALGRAVRAKPRARTYLPRGLRVARHWRDRLRAYARLGMWRLACAASRSRLRQLTLPPACPGLPAARHSSQLPYWPFAHVWVRAAANASWLRRPRYLDFFSRYLGYLRHYLLHPLPLFLWIVTFLFLLYLCFSHVLSVSSFILIIFILYFLYAISSP